tara:strand:+ start:750 stop:1001 length:252 start_codon:yes stop_codon:yes gene_type:complete
MLEIFAAVTGASITAAAMSLNAAAKQNMQTRETIVRLTTAVESLTDRLDEFHIDMRANNSEIFQRLRTLEAAVARLEAQYNQS